MSITVNDLVCVSCSKGDCKSHRRKVILTDKQTGLKIEVICACHNHNENDLILE